MEALRLTVLFVALAAAPPATPTPAEAKSPNFTVTAGSREIAEKVLQRAESLRREISRDWLDEEFASGRGATVIDVRITDAEDYGMTWLALAPDSRPHSMKVRTSLERATGGVLAHEMTHVVVGTAFPKLPAWAHEGAAMLRDDPERLKMRQETLDWFARTTKWPSLENLLVQTEFVPSDWRTRATAASLTEYLLTRGTKRDFLNFAVTGKTDGWDNSLRQYYGIGRVRDLQASWQRWVTEANPSQLHSARTSTAQNPSTR